MVRTKLEIVNGELPEPPYPADTKANGYNLEIDIQRLLNSDTWEIAGTQERPWLLMMYLKSHCNVPTGSLPSNFEVLASKLGCTPEFLEGHKRLLLRGWILHSDGRLYHPVIVEKTKEMLSRRTQAAKRMRRYRERKSDGMLRVTQRNGAYTSYAKEQEQEPDKLKKEVLCTSKEKKSDSVDKSQRFSKPTVEEIATYCRQRNNGIDAETFWHFYEARNWMCGKAKMKSWKSAVITWEKNGTHRSETAVDRRKRINADIEARARSHFTQVD